VRASLRGLSDSQRRTLTAMAERLTTDLVGLRLEERAAGTAPAGGWMCRLCDFEACGRPADRCPAAARARSAVGA